MLCKILVFTYIIEGTDSILKVNNTYGGNPLLLLNVKIFLPGNFRISFYSNGLNTSKVCLYTLCKYMSV